MNIFDDPTATNLLLPYAIVNILNGEPGSTSGIHVIPSDEELAPDRSERATNIPLPYAIEEQISAERKLFGKLKLTGVVMVDTEFPDAPCGLVVPFPDR